MKTGRLLLLSGFLATIVGCGPIAIPSADSVPPRGNTAELFQGSGIAPISLPRREQRGVRPPNAVCDNCKPLRKGRWLEMRDRHCNGFLKDNTHSVGEAHPTGRFL